jgi:RHS repeat-associated protein
VHGRVVLRNETPLPSVRVSVHGRPELGETLTRDEGEFDLVVGAGGVVTLVFEREGFLPPGRKLGGRAIRVAYPGNPNLVHRITPDGILRRFAGDSDPENTLQEGFRNDVRLDNPQDVAAAPDGSVFIGEDRAGDVDAVGVATKDHQLAYDPNGNLASLTPPGRPAHGFQHTAVELEEVYTPPAVPGVTAPQTVFQHNLDRQLELVTRPDAAMLDPVYDPASGRLGSLVQTRPGQPAAITSFGYDDVGTPEDPATGQLETILAPGGEGLVFDYDGFLPTLTTWSGSVAASVRHGYDDLLRVAEEEVVGFDPAGGLLFGYDDDGLLTSAGALTIDRHPDHGLLDGTTLGQVTTDPEPNAFGELATLLAKVSGTPVYSLDVSLRDALGRILRKTETLGGVPTTTDYSYDAAGRLDTVTVNSSLVRDYTYDANGNRLSFAPGDPTQIAFYDAQDRLTDYGATTYTYTANGELATKTEGSEVTSYVYDLLGSLAQVALPDGRVVTYAADGLNRRIEKRVNGVPVQGFLYRDALNPAAELDGAGAVVARFVYGTQGHVPDYVVKPGVGTFRIVTDHLGSVRLVVDAASGVVRERIDYDEFGRVTLREEYDAAGLLLPAATPPFQPFGFAGGLQDPDTGLVRFGARDYDPEVGRWTAKDPIRFAGGDWNLFAYVGNDPTNFVDFEGFGKKRPGKQDLFAGVSNEEVSRIARDRTDPRRQAAITEEKSRRLRNKGKQRGGGSRGRGRGARGIAAGCLTTAHCACMQDPQLCDALLGFDPYADERDQDCPQDSQTSGF